MIVSKLQGGLGNQMFQYAIGRHLSSKYNRKFYLDDRFFNGSNRNLSLDNFCNTIINTDINSIQTSLPFKKIDDNFQYKDIENSVDENYYLDGYWQSEKYFEESSDLNTEFLPGIVFKQLWNCEISDTTKDIIWKYLQLILFSVIGSVHDKSQFGDTSKLFETRIFPTTSNASVGFVF